MDRLQTAMWQEIRRSKSEVRKKLEIRKTEFCADPVSDFGFPSDFGFRISGLGFSTGA